MADKAKKVKLAANVPDADHVDGDIVLSIEKLQEVQDELEKVADIIKEDLWPNPLKYFNNEADEDESDGDEEPVHQHLAQSQYQATSQNVDASVQGGYREVGSYLTFDRMKKIIHSFTMPAEDFPPASTPAGFSGYFSKSAAPLERLINLWPFSKHCSFNGK